MKHSSSLPYAFLEAGVAMISTILKTPNAIKVSMQIMDAFVEMRRFLRDNAEVFVRLENVERKQLKADESFERIDELINLDRISDVKLLDSKF